MCWSRFNKDSEALPLSGLITEHLTIDLEKMDVLPPVADALAMESLPSVEVQSHLLTTAAEEAQQIAYATAIAAAALAHAQENRASHDGGAPILTRQTSIGSARGREEDSFMMSPNKRRPPADHMFTAAGPTPFVGAFDVFRTKSEPFPDMPSEMLLPERCGASAPTLGSPPPPGDGGEHRH